MKEKIYTIPINEAFEEDCECALCFLEKKLEKEAVEYTLGAAMMEPDFRILSNEKGFCNKHYGMLFSKQNKLSLSLILDTHLEELIINLKQFKKDISKANDSKFSFLNKKDNSPCKILSDELSKKECTCVICDKINNTTKRYIDTLFHIWKSDNSFREKVLSHKGFCMRHFNILIKESATYLSKSDSNEFIRLIYNKQIEELSRIQEDIHKFTLKFDYRNKDMLLGDAQTAPIRTIEKISGYILENNS